MRRVPTSSKRSLTGSPGVAPPTPAWCGERRVWADRSRLTAQSPWRRPGLRYLSGSHHYLRHRRQPISTSSS